MRIQRLLTSALALVALAAFAQANPVRLLSYHGGPVLSSFTIYPLYYGNWGGDLAVQQNYLAGLAAYLSGQDAPAGQRTMMSQYGISSANVAPAATADVLPGQCPSFPCILTKSQVRQIIAANQASGKLPPFGLNVLILVLPAAGFVLAENPGGAYHSSDGISAYWAVVPKDSGVGAPVGGPIPPSPAPLQLVTGHEVLEAAADPAVDNSVGWDEAVDGCLDGVVSAGGSWIHLPFGWIPGVHDNTLGGVCSTTGYDSITPVAPYPPLPTENRDDLHREQSPGFSTLYSPGTVIDLPLSTVPPLLFPPVTAGDVVVRNRDRSAAFLFTFANYGDSSRVEFTWGGVMNRVLSPNAVFLDQSATTSFTPYTPPPFGSPSTVAYRLYPMPVPPRQCVGNYRLVTSTIGRRATYTFTGDLLNTAGAADTATATVTSLDPSAVHVPDGDNVLSFGPPVPASSHITSKNTFTVTVDPGVTLDFAKLGWTCVLQPQR